MKTWKEIREAKLTLEQQAMLNEWGRRFLQEVAMLKKRAKYGGKKGRRAAIRLRSLNYIAYV